MGRERVAEGRRGSGIEGMDEGRRGSGIEAHTEKGRGRGRMGRDLASRCLHPTAARSLQGRWRCLPA